MTPKKIIVHHSGTDDGPGSSVAAIRRFHTDPPPRGRGWTDIGYHALVERIGDSYEAFYGRQEHIPGAHTFGQNSCSLGICLVGNFQMESPPIEQLRVASKVVAAWLVKYNIPATELYRHSYFADTDCPGDWFDLEQFRAMVMEW